MLNDILTPDQLQWLLNLYRTFHQFDDLDTGFDLHRITSGFMKHLQRVPHFSMQLLPFWIPVSAVVDFIAFVAF